MSLKPEGSLSISKVNYPKNLKELETITTVKIIKSREREQILVSPTKAKFDQIFDKKFKYLLAIVRSLSQLPYQTK